MYYISNNSSPTRKHCESFIPLDYAMITHSVVGFKLKEFDFGSLDRFPREKCSLGTRLTVLFDNVISVCPVI